jgi:hypothetical protein
MAGSPTERLTLFDVADAVPLAETAMMSMPTYRSGSDDGSSLVWSWFGARTHGDAWADEAPAHQ